MYIDYILALQSTFLSFSYKHIQVLKHFDLGLFSILLHVVPGGINESQLMINKPCIKKYRLVLSSTHCHLLYGRCLFYLLYLIRKMVCRVKSIYSDFFQSSYNVYSLLLQNTQFKSQSCHRNLNCILGLLEEGKEYIIIMAV